MDKMSKDCHDFRWNKKKGKSHFRKKKKSMRSGDGCRYVVKELSKKQKKMPFFYISAIGCLT